MSQNNTSRPPCAQGPMGGHGPMGGGRMMAGRVKAKKFQRQLRSSFPYLKPFKWAYDLRNGLCSPVHCI